MNRNNRVEVAEKTLKIIETGLLQTNKETINLAEKIANGINQTLTIFPNDWEELLIKAKLINDNNFYETDIQLLNCTSIEAIKTVEKKLKIGLLNFASAKNPGGGFLGGASAQEESLARSSSLYASQTKDMTMYHYNRNQSSFLYSDYMIYSPNILFWFDDNGNTFDNPLIANVITSPAPNKSAMLQHNRKDEITQIEGIFKSRIEKILSLAILNGIESLILGAWGCGVFRNEPSDVARYFKEVIDLKFKNSFKQIIYAVYDSSEKKQNFFAFKEVLLNS